MDENTIFTMNMQTLHLHMFLAYFYKNLKKIIWTA